MNVETITSRQNPLMTHLRKLGASRSYRQKSGEYLCDGTKLLAEALKWHAPVRTAVFSDGADIPELPDKDQLILVYCRSGNRSKQASEKLVKLGYTNIVEIGGINSWPGETVTGDK